MVTTVREDRQEKFLSTLRKGQDITLDALKVLVETVQFVTPERRRAARVSLADRLPSPHEVVDSASDFAEHLLANQRRFAGEVITVLTPLVPGKTGKPAVTGSEGKPAAAPSRASKSAA